MPRTRAEGAYRGQPGPLTNALNTSGSRVAASELAGAALGRAVGPWVVLG